MSDHEPLRGNETTANRSGGKREPAPLRWIDRLSEVTGYVSGACIFVATLVVCYAVVLRAMGHSTIWQTELAVYLLIFVTFVGGAYGLKHGSHVNVDLLDHRLSQKGQLVLQVVRAVLSLVLIAVVGWYSSLMWWEATSLGWTSGTAWNPPLTYIYAILPLGMLLIGLQYLVLIARAISAAAASNNAASQEDQ